MTRSIIPIISFFLISSLSYAQEVAIDLSIDRLSPRAISYSPEMDWRSTFHPLLEVEFETSSEVSDYQQEEGTVDDQKHRFWKIEEIILNAPDCRPHFLIKERLPHRCSGIQISEQDIENLEKIISDLQTVY
ncbi:hypothetical protein [Tunicatimonas pelagia]|uniref:hypothetical protein n=1 Tax=Tunicatimonas pelagia TaxID=931531 RepID=UPI00266587BB|nr:hypothetical protein [Tunicatimonas pelagia]WKN44418.1 hypothetical protein P0M28_05500 [Tunicatimonas pelagia]